DSLVSYAASDGSGSDHDALPGSSEPQSISEIRLQPSVPPTLAGHCPETREGVNSTDTSDLVNTAGPSSIIAPRESHEQLLEIDSTLVNKLEKFKALREQGIYFNDNLVKNKSYRNPHIYTKLVQFVDVEETGTNFPPEIWNPLGFPPDAYADVLRENQQRAADARQLAKTQSKRTEIQFEKSSSIRKMGRSQDNGNKAGLDYSHDREKGQRDRERERNRDQERERDCRRGGSRSPRRRR
ncbi:hypothetical protein CROQUDRAFT_685119, partial [Cronartium quercuum f. sp. fusiforme G11]